MTELRELLAKYSFITILFPLILTYFERFREENLRKYAYCLRYICLSPCRQAVA
jgi:hypothetical protein